MHTLRVRGVNEAYYFGFFKLKREGRPQESRAGRVIVMDEPLTTIYERPQERVLFDPSRDANPFFHLFESLWMIAGMQNTQFLDNFVHDFGSRFAEGDGSLWGAYGFRWRRHWDCDQLDVTVDRLLRDPLDRRVVIAMWDTAYDLFEPGDREPADIPCNTHIYPRLRETRDNLSNRDFVLDLTVCCRSNDMVWGAYGANAVHFSFLQEYLAARLGVRMGQLYQVSNNFHAYAEVLEKLKSPSVASLYPGQTPLVGSPVAFDQDLLHFMEFAYDPNSDLEDFESPKNPWLQNTAANLLKAHRLWKSGQREEAMKLVQEDERGISVDWRNAARNWFDRRMR